MTYSILLVDDESVDLEWLSRRIAGRHDRLDIAGAVNSAFSALEVLRERPVDVLVSDIRMPVMTGLELAARAREIRPQLHVVFVSGYKDFEYAKQAIKVSACAYLLKPVDDRELHETLSQLVARLDAERRTAEGAVQPLQGALPLIEKELVLSWLEGTASPELEPYAVSALDPFDRGCGLSVALLELDDLEWRLNHLDEEVRAAMLLNVYEAVQSWVGRESAFYCMRDKRHRIVLIAACGKERLAELAGEWLRRIREQFPPLTATIALGGAARRTSELPTVYKRALAALKEKLFLGKDRLILPSAVGLRSDVEEADLDGAAEATFRDMLQYRLVSVDERLEELFRQLRRYEHKETIINVLVHFISRLHLHCEQWNENLYELLRWEYGSLDALYRFETIQDMNSWLRRACFELSELLYRKQQRQNRKIIGAIAAFVEERLETRVTLKQAADHFGFSPNYLGQLFKEETGEHFSDYVTRARMRRACELLLDPCLKVYEIADRIGYRNTLYFNRQFKMYVGLTPGAYRKAMKV